MDTGQLKYRSIIEDEYQKYFDLMFEETGDYLEQSLKTLKMTRDEFANVFRTLGEIYIIEFEGKTVGFYWVEYRGKVCHIHALVIHQHAQRMGLGLKTMDHIEQSVTDDIDSIEVGIHKSNFKARGFCGKSGFHKTNEREEVGFEILQKIL